MRQAVVDFEELGRKCVSTLQPGELTDSLILSIRSIHEGFDYMDRDYQEQVDAALRQDFTTLCDALEKEWGESTLARETVSNGVFWDHDGWRGYLTIADQHNGLYLTVEAIARRL